MAFVENEVATSRCSFDWLGSSMAPMDTTMAMNHMLVRQASPYLGATPRVQKLGRRVRFTNACGANAVDGVAFTKHRDHSPYSRTTSDTDSGTGTSVTATEKGHPPHVNKQKSLYKTELCRSWEEKGRCPYGNKCQYAHGTEELRPVARHPKFKTEVCCTFVTTGTCPYGRRCRFIHKNVPITAVGKKVSDSTKKNESYISSANSITAASRRLPIFVKLASGEE